MISAERIPNNVGLSTDRRLHRALEHWQPRFLEWWRDMGPQGFQHHHQVYLRTATSVDAAGWAQFDYVKLPEYRWGIFLAAPVSDRRIGFGQFKGQPVWREVPGEFLTPLQRLIVTQGDTEPASVEQQRMLGQSCPSLYDLRNLFQMNVEEGRHLWAMVYLLHSFFGSRGREEAEELLDRRSGSDHKPRLLNAFNRPIETWLDLFAFSMFTDRDGKSQLMSLSESALDPLSRTTRFMVTEEAHHLFVGETGMARIIERTCQLMRESGLSEDVRTVGGIDLPMIQRHINYWFSQSLDLHGGEVSANAASYFANGLKGRAEEQKHADDHVLDGDVYLLETVDASGRAESREVPMRNALNEVLRDWYRRDCLHAVQRWNQKVESYGIPFQFVLPDRKFHRYIGAFAGRHFDPAGRPVDADEWARRCDDWLPSAADTDYLKSLQAAAVYEPGRFANYIAPPRRGINQQPIDFQYVRTEQ
jgi:benzoyl-CoA 2,3-epoxidase subunit B